jgi:DNA replication protein DnaC
MEHIGEILRRRLARTNTLRANMDTWSGAEEPEEATPSSNCPICKGAGFVHPLLASGKPDFSRVVACRCIQAELDKERQDRLQQYSGLAKLHRTMTFDNFECKRVNLLPEQRQNLEEAYRLACDFAKSPDGWIVLQGVNGCGKTHLAAAIANESLQAGKPALFVVVPDFLDHLRSTFSPESGVSYDQLFESVKNTPLLILDDFGEQSTTPWAQEKLYQVINYRYNARLATVITTCCSLDEIENRISSRLVDPKISLVFPIIAPDYRSDRRSSQSAKRYRHSKKDSQS